jgi:signal transduction histidine kinase
MDVTPHKRAEEALQHSHEYFRNLDRISQVISQTSSSKELLRALAQEVLDIFDVDRAWLFYPCDPQAPSWQVPVEVTRPEYPGAFETGIDIPMDDGIASVLRATHESFKPVIYQFPEGPEKPTFARYFHIQSQMLVALRPKVGKPWVFGMHQCSHQRQWTDDDKRMFRAIADRVTDALANHLLREQLEEDIALRVRAEAQAHDLLRQNRNLTQQLFKIHEEERKHLARELHDECGQWLTAIQLNAENINHLLGKESPNIAASIKAIISNVNQIHQSIRRMLHSLRPALLDELGLADSLRELVAQWQENNPNINCVLSMEGALDSLGETLNITIFRLVQEGLTNVTKHAQASRVAIKLHRKHDNATNKDSVMLTIEDNGKGMASRLPTNGFGLPGMRERVLAEGGHFSVDDSCEKGMRLKAHLFVNSIN